MPDQYQENPFKLPEPNYSFPHPPFPVWLARRLLRRDEQVAWVRGPKHNPSWERYITHPALILVALAIAAVILVAGRLISGAWMGFNGVPIMAGGLLLIGCVYVLGIANVYFTRLVVTNY